MKELESRNLASLLLLLFLIFTFLAVSTKGMVVDEIYHFEEITLFINGDFTFENSLLVMIPGYHVLMATIAKITGLNTVFSIRAFTLVIGFITIFIYSITSSKIPDKQSNFRSKISNLSSLGNLQFIFLPIIFPFFFLIYTEGLSLGLIILALYFVKSKNYNVAGIIGGISFLVRQNNIIWLGFLWIISFFQEYPKMNEFSLKIFYSFSKKNFTFIFSSLIFFIIFIYLGEFALSDKPNHPSFRFHSENIFSFLFVINIIFLPIIIKQLLFAKLKPKKVNLVVCISSLIIFFFLFVLTFKANHGYNNFGENYFLRNMLIEAFQSSSKFTQALYFIPIGISIIFLFLIKFKQKSYYLFYLFSLPFLTTHWLIDPRYLIIPLFFFQIFRERFSDKWEFTQLVWEILLSGCVIFGILNETYFL